MTTANAMLFGLCAVLAIAGALGTIASRRPLRAAMALLLNIIAISGLYLTLHARVLASIQLLVYAGAIVVLFVFVIMLIGPAADFTSTPRGRMGRIFSIIVMSGLTMSLAFTFLSYIAPKVAVPDSYGTIAVVSQSLYREALVPFELVSTTLLVAIVGALAIARRRTPKEIEFAKEDRAKRALAAEKAIAVSDAAAQGGH